MNCVVCSNEMTKGRTRWHYICKNCRHESAHFEDKINDEVQNQNLDEELRLDALKTIRQDNFRDIISVLKKKGFKFNKAKALDVGCAHGWFMESLHEAGVKDVRGIEPDKRIFKIFKKNVLNGYFPNVLSKKDKFDLISFNDVFEHIPDSNGTLKSCHDHLNKNGLLILNLPSSKGVLYKTSKLLHFLTLPSAFKRLWQKGLPSPHVHYYSPRNLKKIAQQNGFEQIYAGRLKSVSKAGLKERVGYDASNNSLLAKLKNKILYYGIYLSIPIFKYAPSDIQLAIYKKI